MTIFGGEAECSKIKHLICKPLSASILLVIIFSCCLFLLTMYIYIYTFCMLLYVYWHMLDYTCLPYLCSILLVAFLPRPQSNGDCIWGCSVHPPLPSGVGHCRCCSVVCEWVVHTHWGAYLLQLHQIVSPNYHMFLCVACCFHPIPRT